MKAVILAGGLGTRLGSMTELIPKPMVEVGGKPLLWHIMSHYAHYGITDFVIALGYKAEVIKSFFLGSRLNDSDFQIDLGTGDITMLKEANPKWTVTLVETGLKSLTGQRLKLLEPYLGEGPFMLTYGDGLSDVNLDDLLAFHNKVGGLVTLTAVRPVARFGELSLEGELVSQFEEKPQLANGWINGGFWVCEPEFLRHISNDNVMLEKEPLQSVAASAHLAAFRHEGFWQCMDTKRDWETLQTMWDSGSPPWELGD